MDFTILTTTAVAYREDLLDYYESLCIDDTGALDT